MNDFLDETLRFLLNDKDKFHPAKPLLNKFGLEEDAARSIIISLERNSHIELKANVYQYADMKITPEGIDFITRTSYKKQKNNSDLARIALMSGTTGDLERKEKLEFEKLTKEIEVLNNTLSDYTRYKNRIARAEFWIIVPIILSIISILFSLKGC